MAAGLSLLLLGCNHEGERQVAECKAKAVQAYPLEPVSDDYTPNIDKFMFACMKQRNFEYINGCFKGDIYVTETVRPLCYRRDTAFARWIDSFGDENSN